jgi:hypothetical protein
MKIIYKYDLPTYRIGVPVKILMPKGAEILTVACQHEWPKIWALVDDNAPLMDYVFYVFETGTECKHLSDRITYLATVLLDEGSYVAHVFYDKPITEGSKNEG